MPKSDLPFRGDQYARVADRITLFYSFHPEGRIITTLISRSDREITFRALVYRSVNEPHPAATGWASERPGDGDVNAVACLENTETSAVGRALANLGFTASPQRPSAEEMEKASRTRARLVREETVRSREGRRRRGRPAASGESVRALDAYGLQSAANAVHDALSLVMQAEALGLPAGRAERLRGWLSAKDVESGVIDRIEHALRGWLARRGFVRASCHTPGPNG